MSVAGFVYELCKFEYMERRIIKLVKQYYHQDVI